ncbi:MAG TPA: hypothetical protein VMW18_02955 [Candidatus Binatia bacterium]|nr:hypothetical protein [Candidatus Binatia bacterium]
MLSSFGISEWVAALITCWLAVQLPLGILVGFYLRRSAVLVAVQASPAMTYRGNGWVEFLHPATPSAR